MIVTGLNGLTLGEFGGKSKMPSVSPSELARKLSSNSSRSCFTGGPVAELRTAPLEGDFSRYSGSWKIF